MYIQMRHFKTYCESCDVSETSDVTEPIMMVVHDQYS